MARRKARLGSEGRTKILAQEVRTVHALAGGGEGDGRSGGPLRFFEDLKVL